MLLSQATCIAFKVEVKNRTHDLGITSTLLFELHEPYMYLFILFLGDNR